MIVFLDKRNNNHSKPYFLQNAQQNEGKQIFITLPSLSKNEHPKCKDWFIAFYNVFHIAKETNVILKYIATVLLNIKAGLLIFFFLCLGIKLYTTVNLSVVCLVWLGWLNIHEASYCELLTTVYGLVWVNS